MSQGMNASNFTNASSYTYTVFDPTPLYMSVFACSGLFIFFGTVLNIWFMIAILTSPEMRARMRNKLIVNMAVVHLTDCFLKIPFFLVLVVRMQNRLLFTCLLVSVAANLQLLQDFVANWTLIILLAFFIANIRDYDPTGAFTPLAITIATTGVLALPWVFSLITVPAIMKDYHNRRRYLQRWTCIFPTMESWEAFRAVDTVVPLVIALILLSVACFFRRQRFSKGVSGGAMRTELIGRGREIDSSVFYAAAVGVAILCDIVNMLSSLNAVDATSYVTRASIDIAGNVLGDARVMLMPITWLLLPDIRQRIKTWRPWYRPAPGIDLTVAYGKAAE